MNQQATMILAAALRRVLPHGVAVAATETVALHPPLGDTEQAATGRMSPQRLLEFRAGRACARAALLELGLPSGGIAVGQDREPLWPGGVTGSISHSRRFAAAAVAPRTVLRALGIDIEPALPLDPDLLGRVCRPAEVDRLMAWPEPAVAAKRAFSAKESVYKCLWPELRVFLEFADVEIVLNAAGDQFQVIGWGPLQGRSWANLAGRLTSAADHIVAVAYVTAERPVVRPERQR